MYFYTNFSSVSPLFKHSLISINTSREFVKIKIMEALGFLALGEVAGCFLGFGFWGNQAD